jgi:ubiquinone/menaquinone biosynthesis C-methylase UbiE
MSHPRRSAAGMTVALLLLAAVPALARSSDDATSHRRFDDPAYWSKVFDDPGRAAWQKPEELVAALGLRPGQCVADLGAGTGYFSRLLSAAVGPTGTVLAVDPEPNLVAHLRERAEREGSANVVPVLASLDNPRLPAGLVDVVLIVDTFHHIDDRVAYFRRLRQALRPPGRIAIVDWQKRELPVGPEMDHKLAREQVVREMETAGYRLVEEPSILPYQYFLIFQPR